MPSDRIRILLVDDHDLVREGVRAMLELCENFEIVGEAGNVAAAKLAWRTLRPDVTIMDMLLPDGCGTDAIADIRRDFPDARFLMLTTYAGDEDIHRALAAGTAGYVSKRIRSAELEKAIRRIHAGGEYIPDAVRERLAERAAFIVLTPRELEVLELIGKGYANKQIGDVLGCGLLTVKAHLRKILAKLGVESRTEAVAVARQRGIIRDNE